MTAYPTPDVGHLEASHPPPAEDARRGPCGARHARGSGRHAIRAAVAKSALLVTIAVSATAAAPALAAATGIPAAAGHEGADGAVYTMTNDVNANAIVSFRRQADGTLTQSAETLTGGKGADNEPPFGFAVVDTSQSLRLSPNGRLLFAVNPGDDSVSSFRVTGTGLELVDHQVLPAGNAYPVSLDDHGRLLYVLNESSGTITGLRISPDGELTPIAGSTQPLSTQGAGDGINGAPAQIGFSPDGRALNVTERLTNSIDTFRIGAGGTPGPAEPTQTPTDTIGATGVNNPFGFAYQGRDNLIVTNANAAQHFASSLSSYALGSSVTTPLTPISPILLSNGLGSCWISITRDGRYAFVSNSFSGGTPQNLSRYSIGHDGALTFLGNTPGGTPADFASDNGLSRDGRYLYVVQPSNVVNAFTPQQAPAPDTSHIDAWRVGSDGSLTFIGSTRSDLAHGLSGIATR